jgi:spore germination protein KB
MVKVKGSVMVLDNGKINSRQFSILIILYIMGSAILNIPTMIAVLAKQDSWIAAIIALAAASLILPLYIQLGNRFSHESFSWYTEEVFGKWLGKLIALLFFVSFPFLTAILSLRNIGDFITTQIMPETPIQAIHILFALVIIMGARLGIETLARAAEVFFPIVIIVFLIFSLLISPQINFDNIKPMLENGIQPALKGSLIFIAYPLLEPIILISLFPFIKSTERNGMALFTGIIIGGGLLAIVASLSILVLGTSTATNIYSGYLLASKINIAHFLERIEGMTALIWVVTLFVRISLLVHITVVGIAQTLNLKEYRFLVLPMSIIHVSISQIVFPSTAYFLEFTPFWTIHAFTMGLFFPIVLWIIGSFKKW